MGTRTLSWNLVLRALFLDGDAYDRLRDDDNPFIEGLFLVIAIGFGTALLSLIGQVLAWASIPDLNAIKQVVWDAYQRAPWWSEVTRDPAALEGFRLGWEWSWRIISALSPSPLTGALRIVIWPLLSLLGWLIYGTLGHLFARLLGGQGSLNQTLGTTALAFSPLLLRGLGIIPFLTLGGAVNTWQLICRYKAIRSAHRLPWTRAFWATLLPFVVYLLFWLVIGGLAVVLIAVVARR
jgi:hypothetical protein